MHSPVTALLWERWRRTRWALIVAISAPLIGWLVRAAGYDIVGGILALSFGVLGLELLAVVLLFGQCEMKSLNLGFPKRLLRFPVRTVTLLSVYVGYGVVAIALPCLIALAFAKAFGYRVDNWWTTLLILETGFIWLQTMAWLTGVRAVFFFLVPSTVGAFTIAYLAARYLVPLKANILCPIIIALCCGISVWNVTADRRGAWISGWRWVDSLFSLFRRRRTKGFRSALHAQTWFESRQIGYLFPITVLGIIGPLLGAMIIAYILSDEFPPWALLSYENLSNGFLLPVIAAWVAGGLSFAVYHRDHASGASSFWLRRPIATRTLAFARLQAVARSVVGVLAILTVIDLALLVWDLIVGAQSGIGGFVPQALEDRSLIEVGIIIALAMFGYSLVCWAFMELALMIFFVTMGLEAAFGLVWLYFKGDAVRVVEFLVSDIVRWSACIVAAGIILGTLWALYVTGRRKLIGATALVWIACAFPVAVVSLWAVTLWTGPNVGWPSLMEVLYFLGAASLPFIPLATTSRSIAKRRHG
jgi:hypothetical protein